MGNNYSSGRKRDRITAGANMTTKTSTPQRKLQIDKKIPVGSYQDGNLCAACQGINMDELSSAKGYLHQSRNDMTRPSVNGCEICKLLLHHFQIADLGLVTTEDDISENSYENQSIENQVVHSHDTDRNPLTMRYLPESEAIQLNIDGMNLKDLCVSRFNETIQLTSHQIPKHPLPQVESSAYCTELIDTWMADADSEGIGVQGCLGRCDELPRRLIDVSSPTLYLKDCSTFSRKDSSLQSHFYIALSHRWSTRSEMPLTETHNLSQRKRRIDISSLPLAFQDAIEVTRLLGIRYIWIDCLCIIQDSRPDWEEESAKMGIYYSSAWLTIAIGIPTTRRLFSTSSMPVSNPYIKHKLNDNGSYIVLKNQNIPFSNQSILRFRGWTFQEEILSPRYVSFVEDQMVFRSGGYYCENHGTGQEEQEQRHTDPVSQRILQWTRVVESYSWRLLTIHSDKLPALSGVAQAHQSKYHDKYYAGLWRQDLIHGLCWYRDPQYKYRTKLPAYRAPSWSWASIDSPVMYMPLDFTYVIEVLHVTTELSSRAEMGTVKGGMLSVIGPVVKAKYTGNYVASEIGMGSYNWVTFLPENRLKRNGLVYWDHEDYIANVGGEMDCLILTTSSALVIRQVNVNKGTKPWKWKWKRIGLVDLQIGEAEWTKRLMREEVHLI